jgi:hypothetical protein
MVVGRIPAGVERDVPAAFPIEHEDCTGRQHGRAQVAAPRRSCFRTHTDLHRAEINPGRAGYWQQTGRTKAHCPRCRRRLALDAEQLRPGEDRGVIRRACRLAGTKKRPGVAKPRRLPMPSSLVFLLSRFGVGDVL